MSEPTIFSDTFLAMGSHCDVVLPNVDSGFAKKVFQLVKNEVEQLENAISRHSLVSEIWQVNNSQKNTWIELKGELWEILTICNDFYQISNGAFDVSVAPVHTIWIKPEQPENKDVIEAKNKCGFSKIEFDLENRRIRFAENDMELDFGAIERGFTLDIIKPLLIDLGVKDAIVSFDEDVVLALGNHPGGGVWPLGIRNQVQPSEFIHIFESSNQSVATTGTVYIRDDGEGMKKRIVISPETGMPVEGSRTVSVKTDSTIMAAFIAHIWLILPETDKQILANQFKNVEILETEYYDNDYKTKVSFFEGEG